ncbi:MAG: hypothetical protein ACYCTF_14180 [Acidiferrobacter sp.]
MREPSRCGPPSACSFRWRAPTPITPNASFTPCAHPLATRTLRAWFARYRQARVHERERLVDYPRLFEAALASRAQERIETLLRDGPEGACLHDMQVLEAILARLGKRLATSSGGTA